MIMINFRTIVGGAFASVLSLAPAVALADDCDAAYERGQKALASSDLAGAKAAYQVLRNECPDDFAKQYAYVGDGVVRISLGASGGKGLSLDALEGLLKYGSSVALEHALGDAYVKLNRFDEAAKAYTNALNGAMRASEEGDAEGRARARQQLLVLKPKTEQAMALSTKQVPVASRSLDGKSEGLLAVSTRGLEIVPVATEPPAVASGQAKPVAETPAKPAAAVPSGLARISLKMEFEFRTDNLTSEGEKAVSELASFLKDNPAVKAIRLIGHTDERGEPSVNDPLSLRRAEKVKSRLRQAQLNIAIATEGRGEREPVKLALEGATLSSEQRFQLDRRVEFVRE
jgi:outer membrane protein OmpA-like peptidoglycan-associated protein